MHKKDRADLMTFSFLYRIPRTLYSLFLVFASFFAFALLLGTLGLAQPKNKMATLIGKEAFRYNLRSPEVITLPSSLSEISGIVYDREDYLFAVDDEQGSLFRIKLQKEPAVEQWTFSKKADFEDLVLVDQMFYLLSSPGIITYFPHSFPITNVQQEKILLSKGRNEFEILFKDPAGARLLLMCKSCKQETKGEVPVYAFNLFTKKFDAGPFGALRVKEIEDQLKEKVFAFKPSAANVHPLTGDIYIISSINQLLVVTDRNFKLKEVHKLEPGLFKQPEGLCFTPSGDLLISNEAAKKGNANILLFRQQP